MITFVGEVLGQVALVAAAEGGPLLHGAIIPSALRIVGVTWGGRGV